MNFTFVVPGEPVPWARARTNGKRHYTDPKVATYKRTVAAVAQACMHPRKPHSGPVVLEMRAVLPIPASWSAKRRAAALEGLEAPGKKPDWDNLGKAVSDALNGVVYVDDAQVVRASVEKVYGNSPQMVVHVMGWAR